MHHFTVKNNLIIGHGGHQQTVGISTKVTCWDWVIRGNTIIGAGTGMYLGNSNGEEPFIRGVIEYNLIENSKGYCMQRAINVMPHQGRKPEHVRIYHNTMVACPRDIRVAGIEAEKTLVWGNLNVAEVSAMAGKSPLGSESTTLGKLDVQPVRVIPEKAGAKVLQAVENDTDSKLDYFRRPKRDFHYRGAAAPSDDLPGTIRARRQPH